MPINWHQRYQQQARWTKQLRAFLYDKARLNATQQILEVGSGTGAILADEANLGASTVFGLDINLDHVKEAVHYVPFASFIVGDGHHLPFKTNTFDFTYCHYLLLWVSDPYRVIAECERVTKSGGYVVAMAEPDYGARIDYPAELELLGKLQEHSLRKQGADPQIGRKIAEIFMKSRLENIEIGIIGAQWSGKPSMEDFSMEWNVLADDINGDLQPDILSKLKKIDMQATISQFRILFVPTFYAIGTVK